MAEELIPGLNANVLMSATDGVTQAILWILVVSVIGGLAWIYTYWVSFKIKALIRETVNGRTLIRYDKVRQFKDKNGVLKWALWGSLFKFKKDNINVPDSHFIDITFKGNKFVEFFRTADGQYLPIRADPKSIEQLTDFEPFTSTQREALVHEFRESIQYEPKNWSDTLLQMAPIIAIIIILALFLIFFNDTVKPSIEAGNKLSGSLDEFTDTYSEMIAYCRGTNPLLAPMSITNNSKVPN